ncbi:MULTISPECIES: serine hydrolase [unclassified Phenylobacterium]|uniref:serine hydrolase domain-containing protein n=1 Tax=unclassified Phenylobacterium TaxID=2640670 RepID=UPI00083A71A1|nr:MULTISPECIES: serine hydrolase domain-containing protein [unclassified Phenylobacterium]
MRSRSLLTATAAAVIVASTAPGLGWAQPATPAEAAAAQPLVDDFIAATRGNARARAAFLARRVAANPEMPRAEFAQLLDAIARTSGGLTLQSWQHRGRLRVTVRAASGKTARVDLFQDSADPSRLTAMIPVAMPTPYDGPKPSAMSRQDLAAAIEARIRFAESRDDFSGAVLVVKDGEVVHQQVVGQADKMTHAPVTPDTRFNIGSMGKQFTAVAIGQLIDQGRLTLDTRLIDVLPDYPNPEAARKTTIRHLLSHRAGLGMLFERPGWDWKLRYERMSELLPLFAAEAPQFEPGAKAAYSNEGFIVLGAVVERLSGQTWYDYVQANIFDRAGMTATENLTDDPAIPNRAVGYKFGAEDPLGFGARQPNWDTLSWRGNACGGQFSTAADMIRFLQALKAGKLLKPETAALFLARSGRERDYGLGFERFDLPNGRSLVGHGGGGPASGVNSDAKMIWETGYAYAVMGNYDAPFAQLVARDIGDLLAAQN